jgi:hypothetical protein
VAYNFVIPQTRISSDVSYAQGSQKQRNAQSSAGCRDPDLGEKSTNFTDQVQTRLSFRHSFQPADRSVRGDSFMISLCFAASLRELCKGVFTRAAQLWFVEWVLAPLSFCLLTVFVLALLTWLAPCMETAEADGGNRPWLSKTFLYDHQEHLAVSVSAAESIAAGTGLLYCFSKLSTTE